MDFAEFKLQVRNLSDIIRADFFAPDIIVGVARGGWPPAMLLSRALNVKRLCSYGLTYTDETRTTISIYQKVERAADVQKILVVEDFIESGKCIKHAIDSLTTDTTDVRTASLGYLEKTILIPTYNLGCVAEIPKLPWD
jgi:hypoxanthine phosphoribosyltransferase